MVVFWYTNWKKNSLVLLCLYFIEGFPGGSAVKNPSEMQETQVSFLGREEPWRRSQQHTPVFLPGEPHGQRCLPGYSPWHHKKLDAAEATNKKLSLKGFLMQNSEEPSSQVPREGMGSQRTISP